MTINIHPFTPDQAEAFVRFFAKVDFSHAESWAGCYCQYYFTPVSPADWFKRPPAVNRAQALELAAAGKLRGLLAWDGEQIAGWCNAADLADAVLLADEAFFPTQRGEVGAVLCFVVDRPYRGQGLAARMLAEAVEGFRADGFTRVLGFPFANPQNPLRQYHGSAHMFEALGFRPASAVEPPFWELKL